MNPDTNSRSRHYSVTRRALAAIGCVAVLAAESVFPAQKLHADATVPCPAAGQNGPIVSSRTVTGDANVIVDEQAGHVFLLDNTGQETSVIAMLDACTGATLHSVTVKPSIYYGVLDSVRDRLFIAQHSYHRNALYLIDTHTGNLVRTVHGKLAAHCDDTSSVVAVDSHLGHIFILDQCGGKNDLSMYDETTGALSQTAQLDQFSYFSDVDERYSRIFALSHHVLNVVDSHSGSVVQRVSLPDAGIITESVWLDSVHDLVYYSTAAPARMYAFRVQDTKRLFSLPISSYPPLLLDARRQLLVTRSEGTSVAIRDGRTGSVLKYIQLPEYMTIQAIDTLHGELLATTGIPGFLYVLNIVTGAVIERIQLAPYENTTDQYGDSIPVGHQFAIILDELRSRAFIIMQDDRNPNAPATLMVVDYASTDL